jgi:two-component system, OmpR family, sensor kinase
MRRGAAVRSPLFLRIFLLMLACVAVVQLLNLLLLIAVQAPAAKPYTVGQMANALRRPNGAASDLRVERVAQVHIPPWSPRSERAKTALAMSLNVDPGQVVVSFPPGFLQREQVYDRSGVPPIPRPASIAEAEDIVIVSDFRASRRLANGEWLTVRPSGRIEPWRWFVLGWLVASVLAVAPFAWALAQRFARPIAAFAAAAERLGRDPRALPMNLSGPAEIADAARAFNQMQARLHRYVDDRAMMVAAVAHDLRTPLMRLGLRLESAHPTIRNACECDIREMQAMISAVMGYVRDTSKIGMRRPLDLRSLAETVIDDAADRGEAVSLEPGEPLVIDADSVALKAMLSNLICNAVKYAGGAEVKLEQRDSQAILTVRDSGPGIPHEQLDRVFDPFFRGERSRNRDTGGMGLGLASARAAARAHGGDIVLENRATRGLKAIVTLPL